MFRRAVQQVRERWAGAKAWAYENALLFFALLVLAVVFAAIMAVTAWSDNTGFKGKTLWDWMGLLIVPAVLAVGAYHFSQSQKRAELEAAQSQKQLEMDLALDKQHQDILQDYLDKMSALLLENDLDFEPSNLRNAPANAEAERRSHVATSVASARTLMVLRSLDGRRVSAIFRFLHDTKIRDKRLEEILSLRGGDLKRVNWAGADLHWVNLEGIDLSGANFQGANLFEVNLQKAKLDYADLYHADLTGSDLRGASLIGANLRDASLWYSVLRGAHLGGANLQGADLQEAEISPRQLLLAASLEGSTMPDNVKLRGPDNPEGPTLEEWNRLHSPAMLPATEDGEAEA